jgi:FolB domain-containing protein
VKRKAPQPKARIQPPTRRRQVGVKARKRTTHRSVPPPTGSPDTIVIADLEVWYRVGVPEAERERPQRLFLSIEMEPRTGFGDAAASDDLARTIDYFAVSRRLLSLGEGRQWRLIETLAVEIAELILADFGAAGVRVEVKKFILPETRHVGVRVERRA